MKWQKNSVSFSLSCEPNELCLHEHNDKNEAEILKHHDWCD